MHRLVALCLIPLNALGLAAPVAADAWSTRKCALYEAALADALAAQGRGGLSAGFLAANEAFIAGGCTEPPSLCASGEAEIALVDLLTVMTMNEGMASTFVPFACSPAD